ncbi:haloacid dehalogenase superfamily enzyme, subfamily IA [Rivularia sp. PCC 7116]|uniref:HAD family hydrolase n=1 Tax=Rivularia sp. PCC 7116 TaxID=373994 RepID=UPI00029F0DA0|nr:HAD family hydrolase [Rivularia sp. PCC 7116]AFY58362.1 haloacid dehalogenase superfamily enzyme, subfamily IA [Rivularia sp. PCC 7116]
MSFINKFDVLLLDVGHSFMFKGYRFFDTEDFAATYRNLGGILLTDELVNQIIFTVSRKIKADGKNPAYYECLPSVISYLQKHPQASYLPVNELNLLEQVFANHEVGVISGKHVEVLHQLAKTHRLGIVSNIWSKKDIFLKEFDRVGIRDLFEIIIFSSDFGWIKPSTKLFDRAIEHFDVEREKIVYIGDHIMRDVGGAKTAGLSSVWINKRGKQLNQSMAIPDLIVKDLQDLV